MSNQAGTSQSPAMGAQPSVANLVGQAGNLQSGIQQNLGGSVGAPDISQLIQRVNAMQTTQGRIMGTPTATPPGMPVASGRRGK